MSKVCTKCGETNPATLEFFHKKLKSISSSCKDCVSKDKKRYQLDKGHEISERRKAKRRNFPEEVRAKDRDRYIRNRESILKCSTRRCIERYHEDPMYKLRKNTSKQLRMVLTGYRVYTSKAQMFDIVGITGVELLDYLWSGFESKYGIDRSFADLKDIHVDHIIPLSTAKTIEDIIRLNHYTNLQLLSSEDNVKKGSKIPDELVKEIRHE